MEKLTLKKTFSIKAPVSAVWEALTNPEIIKQYFFGTETITDWKKGSPIIYKGVWEGKPYEDRGHILDIEKEKFVLYNYWSSFSGKKDLPENYANIRYELSNDKGTTVLTITQDGFESKEALDHSMQNWSSVMDGLKKLVEK